MTDTDPRDPARDETPPSPPHPGRLAIPLLVVLAGCTIAVGLVTLVGPPEPAYPTQWNVEDYPWPSHIQSELSQPSVAGRTTVPFDGPIRLAVDAPFWLDRKLEARIADDLHRLRPGSPTRPGPLPQPGDTIDGPLVAVLVRDARWRWLPNDARIGVDAYVVAVDPTAPFLWPADAFDPTRLAIVSRHGFGVEQRHGVLWRYEGFRTPSAMIDFQVDALASDLANRLIGIFSPPDTETGPVADALRAQAPTLASVLAPDRAAVAAPGPVLVSEGLPESPVCNGEPVPLHLFREAEGWRQGVTFASRTGMRCTWRVRLRNAGGAAATGVDIGPGADPYAYVTFERWRCAQPAGRSPGPCRGLTIAPGDAVDVAMEAEITGCRFLGGSTTGYGELDVAVSRGATETPVETRVQVSVTGADSPDCRARGPDDAALARAAMALDPRRRSGELGPSVVGASFDPSSVTYVAALDEPLPMSPDENTERISVIRATMGDQPCVGLLRYRRTLDDHRRTMDVADAVALRCPAEPQAVTGIWAQGQPIGTYQEAVGVFAAIGLAGLDGRFVSSGYDALPGTMCAASSLRAIDHGIGYGLIVPEPNRASPGDCRTSLWSSLVVPVTEDERFPGQPAPSVMVIEAPWWPVPTPSAESEAPAP